MKDDQANHEGKAGAEVRDPRRDRLKAALRENLKRRKSQARGRDDLGAAPSERADASLEQIPLNPIDIRRERRSLRIGPV